LGKKSTKTNKSCVLMPIYIYISYAPIDVQNQKEDKLDKLSEALH